MAAAAILKNPTGPEVVFSSQTVVHTPIVLKSNMKSGTASSFMRFSPYFYFPIGKSDCRWPIFARNARIRPTLRSRQQTGAECYRTSADDRNTTSGSTGSEYSTSQVTGSNFLPFRGFRVVDLRRQYLRFPSNRKWLSLDGK